MAKSWVLSWTVLVMGLVLPVTVCVGEDAAPSLGKEAIAAADRVPERIGAVVLEEPEHSLYCGVIDETHGYAWFGTDTWPGQVVKIRLLGH